MPARVRRARADAIRRSRDGKSWERRKARTATTEKPVCETRAAGAGAPSCAPAKAPVRESPAMLRRPAIVRVVCCVHVCARKCRVKHSAASDALLETWLLSLFLSKTAHPIFVFS